MANKASSPWAAVIGVNRVLCVGAFGYALKSFHATYPRFEELTGDTVPAGLLRYFTIWTVIISLTFYSMGILCEVFSYLKFNTEHFSFRGLLFHALVFPFSVSSLGLFWSLKLSLASLQPEEQKTLIPWYLNHIIHTLPMIGASIEGLLYFHPFPPRRVGLRLLMVILLAYLSLLVYSGVVFDSWTYSFLQKLPFALKILSLGAIVAKCVTIYFVGEKLHTTVWAAHLKDE